MKKPGPYILTLILFLSNCNTATIDFKIKTPGRLDSNTDDPYWENTPNSYQYKYDATYQKGKISGLKLTIRKRNDLYFIYDINEKGIDSSEHLYKGNFIYDRINQIEYKKINGNLVSIKSADGNTGDWKYKLSADTLIVTQHNSILNEVKSTIYELNKSKWPVKIWSLNNTNSYLLIKYTSDSIPAEIRELDHSGEILSYRTFDYFGDTLLVSKYYTLNKFNYSIDSVKFNSKKVVKSLKSYDRFPGSEFVLSLRKEIFYDRAPEEIVNYLKQRHIIVKQF